MNLRILIISDLPEVGGSSTICCTLAEKFHSWGNRVSVLARHHSEYRSSRGVVDRLRSLGVGLIWSNRDDGRLSVWDTLKSLWRVSHFEPDEVIINGTGWAFVLVVLLRPQARFTYYYINHDVESPVFKKLKWISIFVQQFAVISPVSIDALREGSLRKIPVAWLPQFSQAPSWVGLPLGHQGKHGFARAGFVGALTEAKGIPYLLNLWASESVPCELLVLGDGPCRGDVERCSANADSRVTYCGAFDPSERWVKLKQFFAEIDFLVMPSQRAGEGLPTVILEALSLGVPVLTTNMGGIACFELSWLRPDFEFCVEAVDLKRYSVRLEDYINQSPFCVDHRERVANYFETHFGDRILDQKWAGYLSL